MTTYAERVYPLEFLVSEGNGSISRDAATLVSGAGSLIAGRVLGKITVGGKLTAYDNSASNGSEVAFGVLAYSADATSADAAVTVFTRLCEVQAAMLGWGANDSTGITAGTADLAAKNIIART